MERIYSAGSKKKLLHEVRKGRKKYGMESAFGIISEDKIGKTGWNKKKDGEKTLKPFVTGKVQYPYTDWNHKDYETDKNVRKYNEEGLKKHLKTQPNDSVWKDKKFSEDYIKDLETRANVRRAKSPVHKRHLMANEAKDAAFQFRKKKKS